MRSKRAKQLVTVILLLLYVFFVAIVQPLFFEVHTYFGINAFFIVMPVAFGVIVLFILHIYQNWALMLSLFKKSPDRTKQRAKMQRLVVLIAFMVFLCIDIILGWYEALRFGIYEWHVESLRILFWVATGLIAIHIWQRWRFTLSYFRNIF